MRALQEVWRWQAKELKALLYPQLLSHLGVVTVCLLTRSQHAGHLKLKSHLVGSEANSVPMVYSSMLHALAETVHQKASERQL